MKHTARLCLLASCALSLLVAGCWSASSVESKIYAKALGVDYADGQFIVYTQLLDFSSVAKSDTGSKQEGDTSTFIGTGKGKTINMAVSELYRTAQVPITWGHISAMVITERAMNAHGLDVIDMINRYPEVRYNTWLYTTRDSIEDIFATNSIASFSSMMSILHAPMDNYKQYSMLGPPVKLFKYVAGYNEPAITSYIPSIAVNRTQWNAAHRPLPLLTLTGAYFRSSTGATGYLSRSKLAGYQWMQKKLVRAPLSVEKDGIQYAHLVLGMSKIKIEPVIRGNDIAYRIRLKLMAAMYEYNRPLPYDEMVEIAEDTVKKQIMSVYKEGLALGMDLFNLGQALRHKYPSVWKRITDNGKKPAVRPDSIEALEVKIRIPYNGKYKRIAS